MILFILRQELEDCKLQKCPTPPKRLLRKMSAESQLRSSISSRDSPMKAHQRSRSSSKGRSKNIVVVDQFQVPKRPPRRRQRSKDSIQSPVPKSKRKKSIKKKKSTIVASNVKRKIDDLNKRLDQLEEITDDEFDKDNHKYIDMDMDSQSTNTDQNESLRLLFKKGAKSNNAKMNKDIHALIVTEEKKKNHLQNVISKLRDHKTEHKTLINDLIAKNQSLDIEMRKNRSMTEELKLQSEISEGKLKTVSCLKGTLIDGIDEQNSILLDKMNNVNHLEIELSEMKTRYEALDKHHKETLLRFKKSKEPNSQEDEESNDRNITHEEHIDKLEEAKLEYENKLRKFMVESEKREEQWRSEMDSDELRHSRLLNEKDNILKEQEEKLIEYEKRLQMMTTENEENLNKLQSAKNEITINSRGASDLKKLLEEKDTEVLKLKDDILVTKPVPDVKSQIAHITDNYEEKIKKLEEENENNATDLNIQISELQKAACDKDELIFHLKKDLSNIQIDINKRIEDAEKVSRYEVENLKDNNDTLLNKIKELSVLKDNLERDLEISKNEKNKLICEYKVNAISVKEEGEKQLTLIEANNLKEIEKIKIEHKQLLDKVKSENSEILEQLNQKSLSLKKLEEQIELKENIINKNVNENEVAKLKIAELEQISKSLQTNTEDANNENKSNDFNAELISILEGKIENINQECKNLKEEKTAMEINLNQKSDTIANLEQRINSKDNIVKEIKSQNIERVNVLENEIIRLKETVLKYDNIIKNHEEKEQESDSNENNDEMNSKHIICLEEALQLRENEMGDMKRQLEGKDKSYKEKENIIDDQSKLILDLKNEISEKRKK